MNRAGLLLIAFCWAACAANSAKIVLVAGRPSHGPGEHEFNAGATLLAKCLRQNPGVDVIIVTGGWPADEAFFEGARSIVLYMDGGEGHPLLSDDRLAKVGKLMKSGVGLACLHYAVEVPGDHGGLELLDWIGGFYRRPYSQNPVNDVELTQSAPAHAISRGWDTFRSTDEWYYRIVFRKDDKRMVPILTTMLPKGAPQQETVAWAVERDDGGRGFGFTGGHFHHNWGLEDQRRLVVNAILWTAKVDIPPGGANCSLTPEDLKANLDQK
ncbi:MAG TPA: ThuA domain-containing protein [Bryobacteraceae bacterium]|nr:ThuA domain-containing protein [Bryobacteraceae bacterium]